MVKKKLDLFELRSGEHGLVISPMLASFSDHDDREKTLRPHRHDCYGLFLLRSGDLRMLVENQVIQMVGLSLLVVQPGQIHQSLHANELSGWVMFVDGKSLDPKTRGVLEQSSEEILYFDRTVGEVLFCDQLLQAIFQGSCQKKTGPFQLSMMHALINALFYQLTNMRLSLESAMENASARSSQIVQQFKDMVKLNFKSLKKPSAYAAMLNISISHLNDTVKAITGYSATYLLQQEIMGEAQRQLLYTGKTGKEIAFHLGYTDHKYFIRLFTKVVGQSPAAFRKVKHGMEKNHRHQLIPDTEFD